MHKHDYQCGFDLSYGSKSKRKEVIIVFLKWFVWQQLAVEGEYRDILDWHNDFMYEVYWHYRNREEG